MERIVKQEQNVLTSAIARTTKKELLLRVALSTRKPRGRRGSGSLFQKPKGNGRWHIQYNVPAFDAETGKTRSVRKREYCGLPYAQAQKRLAERLGKIARGEQFESGWPRTVAELYTALRTHTENNLRPGSRKLKGLDWRWNHLKLVFAHLRSDLVNSALIEEYKKQRRSAGASLATMQRELAALRRMFRYGQQTGTVHNVPNFGLVKENNVRRGYVDQTTYERMAAEAMKEGLYLRALLETAFTYGWRKSEMLSLRVSQLDLGMKPSMRLYDSKNGEGRLVPIMSNVFPLLAALCSGKKQNDYVFTRQDGKPVHDFRTAWQNMCVRAAVPCPDGSASRFECRKCGAPMDAGTRVCSLKHKDEDGFESKCGGERKYTGLLVHDMRRSAAKRLRESGIHEKLIMDIGGWKTRSMFDRYTITDLESMRHAMEIAAAPAGQTTPQIAPVRNAFNVSGEIVVQ